jgi:protein-S-isoprenylcysteine O-methyltransferase Ste14
MYLAFLMLLASWGISLASLSSSLVLPFFVLYMNRFQILPEEQALRAKFGSSYEQYSARVRRWA